MKYQCRSNVPLFLPAPYGLIFFETLENPPVFSKPVGSYQNLVMLLRLPDMEIGLFEHNLVLQFLDAFYPRFSQFYESSVLARNKPEDRQNPLPAQ